MFPQVLVDSLPKYIQGCKICNGADVHIKENQWENVLYQACCALSLNHEWKHGSHKPGVDITIENVNYSCKTTKTTKTTISISSYRLTKVDDLEKSFTHEIDVVRKNFEYYALLTRNAKGTCYSVYIIPASYFLARKLIWTKKGNNWAGVQKPNSEFDYTMVINKTMSSQLWITCSLSALDKYKILDVCVDGLRFMSFAKIYDMTMTHDVTTDDSVSSSTMSVPTLPDTEAQPSLEDELTQHLANLALTNST